MSGHNKWSSIKHKKGAADAKRGKLFSKFIKEICVAARFGGGDPSTNAKLRTILDKARSANMPNDTVSRAIKRGTGEIEGVSYEEVTFEGYGPAGVAVLVDVLTDNRNRTVAELRNIFSKRGGNLGEAGCVAWMFSKQGVFTFDKAIGEETLMNALLDAGAEDISEEDDYLEVTTSAQNFESVKKACEEAGIKYTEAEVSMVPQNTVKVTGDDAQKVINLMNDLEDHDDVRNSFANFDIDEATLAKLS